MREGAHVLDGALPSCCLARRCDQFVSCCTWFVVQVTMLPVIWFHPQHIW